MGAATSMNLFTFVFLQVQFIAYSMLFLDWNFSWCSSPFFRIPVYDEASCQARTCIYFCDLLFHSMEIFEGNWWAARLGVVLKHAGAALLEFWKRDFVWSSQIGTIELLYLHVYLYILWWLCGAPFLHVRCSRDLSRGVKVYFWCPKKPLLWCSPIGQ